MALTEWAEDGFVDSNDTLRWALDTASQDHTITDEHVIIVQNDRVVLWHSDRKAASENVVIT
jgi:hypothetical protein